MHKEQIGDGINPSPGQRGLIDLGTTFQIDEFGAKEKLSKIKRGNGDFRSGRKKDVWSLFQKDKEDFYQPRDKNEGTSHNIR